MNVHVQCLYVSMYVCILINLPCVSCETGYQDVRRTIESWLFNRECTKIALSHIVSVCHCHFSLECSGILLWLNCWLCCPLCCSWIKWLCVYRYNVSQFCLPIVLTQCNKECICCVLLVQLTVRSLEMQVLACFLTLCRACEDLPSCICAACNTWYLICVAMHSAHLGPAIVKVLWSWTSAVWPSPWVHMRAYAAVLFCISSKQTHSKIVLRTMLFCELALRLKFVALICVIDSSPTVWESSDFKAKHFLWHAVS